MKIKSSKREKIQTKISLEIIKRMNDITFDNGGKFTLLILEDFYDDRSEKYKSFLESNKSHQLNV